MKRFIYIIYFVFVLLMVYTFYMAFRVHDGLIEEHYYIKSKRYFDIKKQEDALGLRVQILNEPDGKDNLLKVYIGSKRGPLSGARVLVLRQWIANRKEDRGFLLKETAPGTYIANVDFPHRGQWYMRLLIRHPEIKTERIWKLDIK